MHNALPEEAAEQSNITQDHRAMYADMENTTSDEAVQKINVKRREERVAPNTLSGKRLRAIIIETQVLLNIDRARESIGHLEYILPSILSPQSTEITHKLFGFYEKCRHLDLQLNTNFFDEHNFRGLISNLRGKCGQEYSYRLLDQSTATKREEEAAKDFCLTTGRSSAHSMASVGFIGPSCKYAGATVPQAKSYDEKAFDDSLLGKLLTKRSSSSMLLVGAQVTLTATTAQAMELLASAMLNIEKASEQSRLIKSTVSSTTGTSDESSCSLCKVSEEYPLRNFETTELNAMLCSFLTAQLRIFFKEIRQKFYKERQNDEQQLPAKDQRTMDSDESNASPHTSHLGAIPLSNSVTEEPSSSSLDPSSVCCTQSKYFLKLSNAPLEHKFYSTTIEPENPHLYTQVIQREYQILASALPPGVWVKVFEDRMDLMSVMVLGPENTPYEDGMFFFDIQLKRDYPKSPPACHYICFCRDRLNPNLYENGKVCISLLGTWAGRGTEVWCPNSTLLQVIVSIQGLILVNEPYFNEAGCEKYRGTSVGNTNSQGYNEMATVKVVQSITKIIENPVEVFQKEIQEHLQRRGQSMYERFRGWLELSEKMADAEQHDSGAYKSTSVKICVEPEFPLMPGSYVFRWSMSKVLCNFKAQLDSVTETAEPQN